MGYKIKNAFKKSKKVIIVTIALWILISIVLVSPITVAIVETTENGIFNFGEFIIQAFSNIVDIGKNLSKVFKSEYIGTFWKVEGFSTLVLLFVAIIGFVKAVPKNEYTDIEHGSSDWATGEEYKILSKKKGILLAEKHYLPVNKRGNVNVLIVGRFWIW